MPSFLGLKSEAEFAASVDEFRRNLDTHQMTPLSEALATAFPVNMETDEIDGVRVEIFTPVDGVESENVLINLHGGGFYCGAPLVGRVESIPLALVGKFKVISVDYRQGYEHSYPAATEDVVAVYRSLLKQYPADRIGIYGGSAGAILTGQVTAWLLEHQIEGPGAVGMLCGGAGGSGDSVFFSKIGSGEAPPPAERAIGAIEELSAAEFGYMAGVSKDDYLAFPQFAPNNLLSRFPPTLIMSATRAFDMSPSVTLHRALVDAGVDASLHIFDGLRHCFYYNAWLPESKAAYEIVARFFRRYLA